MDQVHQLAAATETYDGIVFTDKEGNILTEQFDEEDTDTEENSIATEINTEHISYMEEHTTNQNNQVNEENSNTQPEMEDNGISDTNVTNYQPSHTNCPLRITAITMM